MRIKSIDLEIKSVKGRTVTFYASAFGNKDLDGDIIRRGAFAKSIREKGPTGTGTIRHLAQHDTKTIIGRILRIEEDATGLLVESTLLNTSAGNDYMALYGADVLQHSIGFVVPTGGQRSTSDGNEITEIDLYEVSAVTWGANPNTPTVGIKSRSPDAALVAAFASQLKCLYR